MILCAAQACRCLHRAYHAWILSIVRTPPPRRQPVPRMTFCEAGLMRALPGLVLFGGVVSMATAVPVHYVDVVNESTSSVAAVSATADGMRWERLAVDYRSLRASSATTLALPHEGGCRRDFRIDFVDGRRMTVSGFDICRNHGLHLRTALARAR
jgi:hypothetical protein